MEASLSSSPDVVPTTPTTASSMTPNISQPCALAAAVPGPSIDVSSSTMTMPLASVQDEGTSEQCHSDRVKNPDGTFMRQFRAKCRYCNLVYATDSRSTGTATIKTHLEERCLKSPLLRTKKKQKQLSFESFDKGGNLVAIACTPKKLVLEESFLHLRCCCHILNLIVRDGMEELDSSIEAIRNCVKYIRSSQQGWRSLESVLPQKKLSPQGWNLVWKCAFGCHHTWNSTYIMLEIAVKYKIAFRRLLDDDPQFEAYFSEEVRGETRARPPQTEVW